MSYKLSKKKEIINNKENYTLGITVSKLSWKGSSQVFEAIKWCDVDERIQNTQRQN